MQPQTADGLAGLLEWSGPVIFDRLLLAYVRCLGRNERTQQLAKLHGRVWRALLMGDLAQFETLRNELVERLASAGLTLDHLADADNQTMAELVDIVIARFRRSPRASHGYHMALLQVAGQLRPPPAAQAA